MLTKEQISTNRDEYINLILSINREGAELEKLVNKLNNSDFFYAPASTEYHCGYEGGLCEHSLNVYRNLVRLCESQSNLDESCYDPETLKIVALLHDISKMNIYEKYAKNTKVYSENGSKYDELGKFDWVSSLEYKVKKDKFVYGNHEETSEYIARQFIPLTLDESVAIMHHMGGRSWDSSQDNISLVFGQYPLSLMLHMADMCATFIDERAV